MRADGREGRLGYFSSLLAAATLPTVLFVGIPLSVYLPNAQELLVGSLYPFAGLFAVSLAVLASILAQRQTRTPVARVLFFAGAYFLLSDVLAPVQLGPLEGMAGQHTPAEPPALTLIDAAILAGAVAGAAFVPHRLFARAAPAVAAGIIAGQLVVAARPLFDSEALSAGRGASVAPQAALPAGGDAAPGPSVYHIVLDAFSGLRFLEALDLAGAREAFDGFTYFPSNRSNYVHTALSVPSFMTATFLDAGAMHDWRKRWRKGAGILTEMARAGYPLSSYKFSYCLPKAVHCIDRERMNHLLQRNEMLHFADLWLVRVAPNYLQDEAYADGKGAFSRLLAPWLADGGAAAMPTGEDLRPYLGAAMIRRMAADESERPARGHYVKGHFYIPHGPYVLDADCAYRGQVRYIDQAACAVRLVGAFLNELRRLGRYRDSGIVVHSDHGTWQVCGDLRASRLDAATDAAIEAGNVRGESADRIDCQTRALLAVKPPGAEGTPLAVSERRTQLLDIPATIYDMAGLPALAPAGHSVLAPDFPGGRDIHVFVGFKQRNEADGTVAFGNEIEKGRMNHYLLKSDGRWAILDDFEAVW